MPTAGNFLNQELAILTGAIEAMVVDVQCIMQAIAPLSEQFHTEVITTSKKVKISGAMHMEFDEHRAMDAARQIVRRAVDNFPKRGETKFPSTCPIPVRTWCRLLPRVYQLCPGGRLAAPSVL